MSLLSCTVKRVEKVQMATLFAADFALRNECLGGKKNKSESGFCAFHGEQEVWMERNVLQVCFARRGSDHRFR